MSTVAGNRAATLSLPKHLIKVLLLEGVHQSASDYLAAHGYHNVARLPGALDSDALHDALKGVHLLGIRSRTQMDQAAFAAADKLIAMGCFSVGTNQVDLEAGRAAGIPVFNAPFSNTRSVAELVIGEVIMLMRRILPRSEAAHVGGWDKSATDSHEVRGKTLGIVGYGNIGSQLSTMASALGMRTIYFDVIDKLRHGTTEPVPTLDYLLAESDVVTLHVPENAQTAGMIGAEQLSRMRRGAFLINNSRGTVVDLDALAAALRSGHLRGAAVDVFPIEPTSNKEPFVSPLQGLSNVILTPHIGASTVEAQERIGEEVARKLVEYSDVGSTLGAVNFPHAQLPPKEDGSRYIHIHRSMPGVMRQLNDVFASRGLNIAAQSLQTDGEIGYVVVDVDAECSPEVLTELKGIEGTVRARVLR